MPGPSAQLLATQSKLDQRIPSFKTDREPLAAVIDRLHSISALPMHIDWASLKASDITADAPITMRLRDLPLGAILKTAFGAAAGNNGYRYVSEIDDDGSVQIVAEPDLPKLFVIRTYDVRDLPSSFEFPQELNVQPSADSTLRKLLTDVVDSDSWAINGGTALIDENNGQLVVTNTQQTQRALRQTLLQLHDWYALRSLRYFLDPSLGQ
jgi:hypothetical protein